MGFTVNSKTDIVIEDGAWPGVKRIAGYVSEDMRKIFGNTPKICKDPAEAKGPAVIAATIGKSAFLDRLVTEDGQDTPNGCGAAKEKLQKITGLREVYTFVLAEGNLIIAGSDKRGTIYGLFKFSELLGVSPFVNWGDVAPIPADEVEIDDEDLLTSKEPSVEYRGFFINDEWPAFGNWCNKKFGGFNAQCYERVFELVLRLKGNYLWPAMWSAQFNLDGPGIENARLADEMGVVMGMSHHEPCCRNGEEYKYVRGKDSVYGDDWNFVRNREGIIRFWEDGLKRNASFENVITVGMRGEADSTILGHEATLKDNIDYLKDVLTTQEELIGRYVNADVKKVPRMLALYKEVEPFFYGDEETPGLMGAKELDGVTLMLCDDNFGNLRTIPTRKMQDHEGGYGMYYHFDYHGAPISYEWVNSSYLPKIWDQMTTAYDNGIRKLWIVNVGDIYSTEFPLAYFLDLAYDYDRWGAGNTDSPAEYSKLFAAGLFPDWTDSAVNEIHELLKGYTQLAHCTRPETLNADRILENAADRDLDNWYVSVTDLMDRCEALREVCPYDEAFRYFEFVYYPLMANLNLQKMWLLAAKNKFLAGINAVSANEFESEIEACLEFDRILTDELHSRNNGFWYGMGMSEHIGFINWNEEECRYPVISKVFSTAKKRIAAVVPETLEHSEGGDWTGRELTMKGSSIELLPTSRENIEFTIEVDDEFVEVSRTEGVLSGGNRTSIEAWVDPEAAGDAMFGSFTIKWPGGHIKVKVPTDERICGFDIPAKDYRQVLNGTPEQAVSIADYGVCEAGVRICQKDYNEPEGSPVEGFTPAELVYTFDAPAAGEYEIGIYMSPSNPPYTDNKLLIGIGVNDEETAVYNVVPDNFKVGDNQKFWSRGVLDNVRVWKTSARLTKGANILRMSALSIGIVFEKIHIRKISSESAY